MRSFLIITILIIPLNVIGQKIEFSLALDKLKEDPHPVEIIDSIPGIRYFVTKHRYPEFPGGMKALDEYFKTNSKLTEPHITNDGIVYVEFTINERGFSEGIRIIQVTAIDDDKCNPDVIDDKCKQEVIRLIWNMPRWFAAVEEGKVIKTKMILPIFVTTK